MCVAWTLTESLLGLSEYFPLFDNERLHQSLKYKTTDVVYTSASGGSALIIDKYFATYGLPIALYATGTAFDEVRIEPKPARQN